MNIIERLKTDWRKILYAVLAVVIGGGVEQASLGASGETSLFGAGYTPVTGYQSRTTSYVAASAATIPVASTKDPAGNQIVLSNISSSSTVKVYFNLEPGTSREEGIYCTGVTSASWTGCVRGLPFQGGSDVASTTLQIAHNAGAPIIMTNISQFYNEFVAVDGTQDIYGLKVFTTFPRFSVTSTSPTMGAEFATKFYVDTVGAGGFTANNVSSTLGLQAISSGTPNCPTAAACVGINASSTASTNGGFLKFVEVSTGKIYWDVVSFIAGSWSWSGTQTFQAATILNSPTTTTDGANKGYVDSSIAYGTATGTAGAPITAGQAVYIGTTSTLFQTNTGANSSTFQFVGFALNTTGTGSVVTYSPPGHINCAQTGLSAGYSYYLNGTLGQIDTTGTTRFARVGRAINANCMQVVPPKYISRGTIDIGATGAVTTTLGFYPAHIEIRAGGVFGGKHLGMSVGDDTNNCVLSDYGSTGGSSYNNSFAYYIRDLTTPANFYQGTVNGKTATSFGVFTSTHGGGTLELQWVAYSE